ncbi:MAG: hypothetical protein MUC90_06125 [Thermoplasmata archaeon]|nr:hypothetical protein [Thermoplasmata archaeon]
MVAGVLAMGTAVALAAVGIAPDGGHSWFESIQTALTCVADKVDPTGGHSWFE